MVFPMLFTFTRPGYQAPQPALCCALKIKPLAGISPTTRLLSAKAGKLVRAPQQGLAENLWWFMVIVTENGELIGLNQVSWT